MAAAKTFRFKQESVSFKANSLNAQRSLMYEGIQLTSGNQGKTIAELKRKYAR